MEGAPLIALAAAVGNLLQGWDSSAIAGALLYIKPEFHLEDNPTMVGLVVAATLVAAILGTGLAGPSSDWLGRRTMLRVSAIFYSLGSLVMMWSPYVYVLLVGRLLTGAGIGLATTIVPILIAESAPTEIRGQLATFPQLTGTSGQFLSYCVVFGLSLTASPSWRLMLGILSIPSLAYLAVCTMFLPESPRWLVSKGHMSAAKVVLQRLRGREDVEAEMALLVEGLEVRGETAFEEYILKPVETVISEEGKPTEPVEAKGNIVIFEPEYSQSWIATPLTVEREGDHRLLSRPGSIKGSSARLLDSTVALLDAIQSNLEDQQQHQDQWEQASEAKWDEESQAAERSPFVNGDRAYEHDEAEEEAEGLSTPLLERDLSRTIEESTRAMNIPEEGYSPRHWRGSRKGSGNLFGSFRSSQGSLPGMIFGSTGNLGGGWQLAWKWEQGEGEDQEGHLKRVFLLQENPEQVGISVPAALHEVEGIPAAALVTEPAPYIAQVLEEEPLVGPATLHPAETDVPSLVWSELREVGVKRALVVGIGLQFFQQFSGINAVLYYLPQILEDAGAESVLSKLGLSSDSSSLLASGVVTLLMLPCIVVAMRLMDRSGRRQLLLATLPVLAISLMVLVVTIVFIPAGVLQALLSFVSITVFACSFVTGLGPVPNIICSEIFPTRARGICIGLCSAVLWVSNVIVSDCFPLLLKRVGLAGAFSIFAIFTIISWIYVFLKVPETKGVPLEVISQIFAYQASAQATKKTL